MKTNKEKIKVMQAFEDGEKIEEKENYCNSWYEVLAPSWNWDDCDYRIKPKSKLRPWEPEEVPVGAVYKSESLIRTVSYKDENTGELYLHDILVSPEDLLTKWSHSIDYGKTWLPCGVLED